MFMGGDLQQKKIWEGGWSQTPLSDSSCEPDNMSIKKKLNSKDLVQFWLEGHFILYYGAEPLNIFQSFS